MSRFFDYHLKQMDNGFNERPKVEYFIIGKNRWCATDSWPPEGVEFRSWRLVSGGRADADPDDGRIVPETEEELCSPAAEGAYTYDPLDPVRSSESADLRYFTRDPEDRTSLERRKDVLLYTSGPL